MLQREYAKERREEKQQRWTGAGMGKEEEEIEASWAWHTPMIPALGDGGWRNRGSVMMVLQDLTQNKIQSGGEERETRPLV